MTKESVPNRKEKIEIIPKSVINKPKDEIAICGNIYTVLDNYLSTYYDSLYKHYVIRKKDFLEFYGQDNESDTSEFLLIRIYFRHTDKQIQILGINVGQILKYKGIGKKLISLVFDVCKEFDYRLFIVDMVESFYENLLKRGAIKIDLDTVEITENTDLENHY